MKQYKTLYQALHERGLSMRRLARATGIHACDLYSATNGNKKFYPGWKNRIAEYLQMEPSELFPEEEERWKR